MHASKGVFMWIKFRLASARFTYIHTATDPAQCMQAYLQQQIADHFTDSAWREQNTNVGCPNEADLR